MGLLAGSNDLRGAARRRKPASSLQAAPAWLAIAAAGCRPGAAAETATSRSPATVAAAPRVGEVAPLPSWRPGREKQTILDFVARVSSDGTPDFVPLGERIAVFDNDGTLWGEQPIYVQGAFVVDRVKELAPQHPDWRERQPFKGVLEGDLKAVAATGEQGLTELLAATHAGNTTDEFAVIVAQWMERARHPILNRPYTDLVYQPMLELLELLRENDFKLFVVSGGGVEFMRPWVERVYGIPKERIVGSRVKVRYEVRAGLPVLVRLPEVDLVDDKAGKPVGIHQLIGHRPIAAFGNSDGDFQMLEWTTAAPGTRLGVIIHHTDAEREWAYDRKSHVGQLARALDEAPQRGWVVVDMKRDWEVIYPSQK